VLSLPPFSLSDNKDTFVPLLTNNNNNDNNNDANDDNDNNDNDNGAISSGVVVPLALLISLTYFTFF
jgi:hypothetical protein